MSLQRMTPVLLTLLLIIFLPASAFAKDPLPSWNDGTAKEAILSFVNAVTDKNSKDYVEPAERIATFDNDGTLWVEYPMYTKALFAFDPETVADRATFKEPCQTSAGMKHVLVNGTFLIRDEQLDTGAFPGQPVRRPIRE